MRNHENTKARKTRKRGPGGRTRSPSRERKGKCRIRKTARQGGQERCKDGNALDPLPPFSCLPQFLLSLSCIWATLDAPMSVHPGGLSVSCFRVFVILRLRPAATSWRTSAGKTRFADRRGFRWFPECPEARYPRGRRKVSETRIPPLTPPPSPPTVKPIGPRMVPIEIVTSFRVVFVPESKMLRLA